MGKKTDPTDAESTSTESSTSHELQQNAENVNNDEHKSSDERESSDESSYESSSESSSDESDSDESLSDRRTMDLQNDVISRSQVFSGKNYPSWKKLIQVNLRAHGWSDVLTPYEEPVKASDRPKAKKDRDRREGKAFAFIYNRLDTARQAAVNSADTPIELFKILDATYERRGPVDVVAVQTKIGAMRYELKNPLEEHLAEFERLCTLLESASDRLPF